MIFLSSTIGALVGLISAKTFFAHSWTALIFWAVAGILIGFFSKDKKAVLWNGALFGFFLILAFLLFGFQGEKSKLPSFILLSIALSLLGALCGLVDSLLGSWINKLSAKKK